MEYFLQFIGIMVVLITVILFIASYLDMYEKVSSIYEYLSIISEKQKGKEVNKND